jgi:uncharacterized protein
MTRRGSCLTVTDFDHSCRLDLSHPVTNLEQLRVFAVSHSLFRPETLKAAIHRMGFVQADPIRSPARAQDLILRHRVNGYKAGDLELHYRSLDIEEDDLYAYGFLSREVWRLLHPRAATRLPKLDQKVLELVRAVGAMHPSHPEAAFGGKRVINAWGGYSKATKRALERLHYSGLLRIAHRQKGIRVYEAVPPVSGSLSPDERLQGLVLGIANILAPVPEKTLHSITSFLRQPIARAPNHRKTIQSLISAGELERQVTDEVGYLWPAGTGVSEPPPRRVRFLAPFDPVVWDRTRFEHLWGWPYRFEAYTPAAKRVRGYYAMPLLWVDRIIGWVNAAIVGGKLAVDIGFVGKRPADREFKQELEAEIARLELFLDRKESPQPS